MSPSRTIKSQHSWAQFSPKRSSVYLMGTQKALITCCWRRRQQWSNTWISEVWSIKCRHFCVRDARSENFIEISLQIGCCREHFEWIRRRLFTWAKRSKGIFGFVSKASIDCLGSQSRAWAGQVRHRRNQFIYYRVYVLWCIGAIVRFISATLRRMRRFQSFVYGG